MAELEATTVAHGNKKLEVKLYGATSTAILFWDDGDRADQYVVTNDGEGTKIDIAGESATFAGGFQAGFLMEIGLIDAGSGTVSQDDRHGPTPFEVPEANVFLTHERLGRLTLGQIGGEITDNSTEADISGSALASYSGVEDIGGGFFLRRFGEVGAGGQTPVAWGDLIDHLPGVDGVSMRYDSPRVGGFALTLETAGRPFSEVLLTYEAGEDKDESGDNGESGFQAKGGRSSPFQIASALSLFTQSGPDLVDYNAISGSASLLHKKSGMSLTVAGGQRNYIEDVEFNDGSTGSLEASTFFYLKAGLVKDFFSAGETALYGEYGRFRNFLGRDLDLEGVESLAGLDAGDTCTGLLSCTVSKSQATIWGVGAVQYLSEVELQIYLGYRHHTADIDLADKNGVLADKARLEDFDTVMVGMLIDF